MSDEELVIDVEDQLPAEDDMPAEAESATAPAAPELPTIGRIVLYHTAVKSYPAIVTAVYPTGFIDLVVFGSPLGSAQWRQTVRRGGEGLNNTWSWPPREEG